MAYNISPTFAALGITAFDSNHSLSTPSLTSPVLSHATPLTTPAQPMTHAASGIHDECTVEHVSEYHSSYQSKNPCRVFLYSAPTPMVIPTYEEQETDQRESYHDDCMFDEEEVCNEIQKDKVNESNGPTSWFWLSMWVSVACVVVLYFHESLMLHGWQFGYYGALLGFANVSMVVTGIIIIRRKLKQFNRKIKFNKED